MVGISLYERWKEIQEQRGTCHLTCHPPQFYVLCLLVLSYVSCISSPRPCSLPPPPPPIPCLSVQPHSSRTRPPACLTAWSHDPRTLLFLMAQPPSVCLDYWMNEWMNGWMNISQNTLEEWMCLGMSAGAALKWVRSLHTIVALLWES